MRSVTPLLLLVLLGCPSAERNDDTASIADTAATTETGSPDTSGDDSAYVGDTSSTTTDGCLPSIAVAPAAIDFGDVARGDEGSSASVAVTNVGCADLEILDVQLDSASSPAFTLSTALGVGMILPPSGTTSLVVACIPNVVGLAEGSVHIYSNDAVTPDVEVSLVCHGVE